MPEYVAHQQVAKFMNRSAYPGRNQNTFPAKGYLDIEVGPVFKKTKYKTDKNQRACDIEGLKQAYPKNSEYLVFQLPIPSVY